ncbi:threonine synthase [Rhodothermus profundi]|uniref:Threonine synthase n=1 Tax=Rhodothermus profundi TaxID=633813 RepID=A0A1M6SEH7_9BACT|nr:threonine synthase [Rhodothermus profundi]SHK43143.1 threonine synthase [Rhodothermus profundi]
MATAEVVHFVSTRGEAPALTFDAALLQGLAPDGGLYIPERIPQLPPTVWQQKRSFSEMAADVLARWLQGVFSEETVARVTAEALSFPVPLVPLGDDLYVLELFHGPTLSFKDVGARTMARLARELLRQRDEQLLVLVATSGDTGSAVADGFAGVERVRVGLLYPYGQVSPVQERQLIVRRPGVQAFAVRGTFDDCQRLVKAAFADPDFARVRLSSANSINIGRLLPQMLYYIWAVATGNFEEVVFCVPSGNLGNLTGGVLAALSGLPVRRFIAAHNANDFFPRFLAGEQAAFGPSRRTLSNAMDVGAPSNFERLQALLGTSMPARIWGTSVSDEATLATIRHIYETTGYLPDPHTAVGLEAARRYRAATGDRTPLVVLATAHPAKFPEVMQQALGFKPEAPETLARLWKQDVSVVHVNAELEALKAYLLSDVAAGA